MRFFKGEVLKMALNVAISGKEDFFNSTCYHDMSSCHIEESLTSCHSHGSCHDQGHEVLQTYSCHESCSEENYKKLSKDDWNYLVSVLESWRVFNPRSVIKRYGALNAWEAMIRTKDFSPRVPGAYFTKVIRSLTGMDGKLRELRKQQERTVTAIEAFKDYKAARVYLESITSKDLENPEIALNVNKLKAKWNFG